MKFVIPVILSILYNSALFIVLDVYPLPYVAVLSLLFHIGLFWVFRKDENVAEDPLSNVKRLVVVGPAGSGKDHLRMALHKMGYTVDVPYTTRPMRENEIDGLSYNFVSIDEFNSLYKDRKFYFVTKFNNAYYATSKESWEYSKVFIMPPSQAKIHAVGMDSHVVVYLNIGKEIRRERYISRSDRNFDTQTRRFAEDSRDLENFEDFADIVIENPFFEMNEIFDRIRSLE
jgi:guanylate kinase